MPIGNKGLGLPASSATGPVPFPGASADGILRYLRCEIASSLLEAREDMATREEMSHSGVFGGVRPHPQTRSPRIARLHGIIATCIDC